MQTISPARPTSAAPADPLLAIKARQQAAWSAGDFAVIGCTLQIVGESLCEAADIGADERVLDVAAGNGNASLAAARRFARVTSTDYVGHLLDKGRLRAQAERLPIEFREADVENLPFDDARFDAVLSTFGAMFAPNQARTAAELLRVTRPGGRIALANWTPEGFIGQLFKTIGKHVPPAPQLESPALWGTPSRIDDLFGDHASGIGFARREFNFRYRSAEHWIEVFRGYYGPVLKAFEALDGAGQARLHADLVELLGRFARPGPGFTVPGEYAEVVIRRR